MSNDHNLHNVFIDIDLIFYLLMYYLHMRSCPSHNCFNHIVN